MTNLLKTTKIILLAVLFIGFTSSCSEDEETVVIDEANLTTGTWTYAAIDADNETLEIFLGAFLDGEEITFNTDGTYDQNSLGYEYNGTWSFSNNQLIMDKDTDNEIIQEVKELSSSKLKLYGQETTEDGDTYAITITYTK